MSVTTLLGIQCPLLASSGTANQDALAIQAYTQTIFTLKLHLFIYFLLYTHGHVYYDACVEARRYHAYSILYWIRVTRLGESARSLSCWPPEHLLRSVCVKKVTTQRRASWYGREKKIVQKWGLGEHEGIWGLEYRAHHPLHQEGRVCACWQFLVSYESPQVLGAVNFWWYLPLRTSPGLRRDFQGQVRCRLARGEPKGNLWIEFQSFLSNCKRG